MSAEQPPVEEEVSPEAAATAVRTRRIILVVLIALSLVTVSLGITWVRTGAWTPRLGDESGAACPVQMMTPAAPRDTKVNVYNGTDQEGTASAAAEDLAARGFVVSTVGNAQVQEIYNSAPGLIVSGPGTMREALAIQRQVPRAAVTIQPRRSDGQVDLLLSNGYTGLSVKPRFGPGRLTCTQMIFED